MGFHAVATGLELCGDCISGLPPLPPRGPPLPPSPRPFAPSPPPPPPLRSPFTSSLAAHLGRVWRRLEDARGLQLWRGWAPFEGVEYSISTGSAGVSSGCGLRLQRRASVVSASGCAAASASAFTFANAASQSRQRPQPRVFLGGHLGLGLLDDLPPFSRSASSGRCSPRARH